MDMPLAPADGIRIPGDLQRMCCFTGFNGDHAGQYGCIQGVGRSIASDNPKDYALLHLY
ncbi:hypothetical protein [Endozoicomonas sp. ONNA2]|uniref:hypothetical protein n=1 Tax=Endozoicomonas sp. ONNA2 TaxID=2828741 RepID=UPI0021493547|nr:hypothetical protein [Endozoicomonas sp. ONNA2]